MQIPYRLELNNRYSEPFPINPQDFTQIEIKRQPKNVFHSFISSLLNHKNINCCKKTEKQTTVKAVTQCKSFQYWREYLFPLTCLSILCPHGFSGSFAAARDCSKNIQLEAQRWLSQQLSYASRRCDLFQFGSLDKLIAHFLADYQPRDAWSRRHTSDVHFGTRFKRESLMSTS